jgi:beta-xylosidase
VLVYDGDFPDPYGMRVGARYFAYATQSGPFNVQVMTSPDLLHWEHLGEALPVLPAWSRPGFTWSPAVLQRGGTFVLYVAVREPHYDRQAIAVAVADSPAGPFRPVGAQPLVFQRRRGGTIDPDPFVDRDGSVHLLYKSDNELVGGRSELWSQPLAADGLSFAGRAKRVLRHDLAWESPLIEAPCLLDEHGYWLFYSAGHWTAADYGIGCAAGTSPEGRFQKISRNGPWLGSHADAAGPGGQSVVLDQLGSPYLLYHAWAPDRVGYESGGARRLHVSQLTMGPQGPVPPA